MCKKINNGNASAKTIDVCMKPYIDFVKRMGHNPVASCCGHGKYPPTIVCKNKHGLIYEIINKKCPTIPRKRNFYRRDSEGYYFIPEVEGLVT